MTELTVGYVAGLIALGIFIAHILSPTAINLILAGVLGDKETAATWSVAGRSLQSSYWPDILRSDTARFHGVRSTISYLSASKTILTLVITIAGIVTPLGLYEDFEAAGVVFPGFDYAPDTTAFGVATPPRSNSSWTRVCYYEHGPLNSFGPCPYSDESVVVSWNGTALRYDYPDGYNTSIATILLDIYGSGTRFESSTIANYFDIQWRQYGSEPGRQFGVTFNDGSPMLAGRYQTILPLYIEQGFHLIEGLIVDTKEGGIGFRNHTVPAGLQYGASWSEDILFIEPETRCVDTNLTLEFTLEANVTAQIETGNPFSEFSLVDKGGFVHLNQTYPFYDHAHAQDNPDLEARAYKAAYLFNAWLMAYMNVTSIRPAFQYVSSNYDQRFPLPAADTSNYLAPSLSSFLPQWALPASSSSFNTGHNISYANPFNVTANDFAAISTVCSGAGPIDLANISNIHVSCGLLRGPPRPLSGGSPLFFSPGSKWSSSLFTCASTVKANIKKVSFQLNGNSGLSNLSVSSITPKSYPSTADMPYWGVEDSDLTLDQIKPLWGLLSSSYAKANLPNVSVVQKPELYLTGAAGTSVPLWFGGQFFSSFDNAPASDFWFIAISTLYHRLTSPLATNSLPDYMGGSSLAALARWQGQASDRDGAAAMLNIIWTDIAAPAVVGTKGVSVGQPPGQEEGVSLAVAPVLHRIKYRIVFAIPAFVAAALLVVLLGATVGMALLRKANVADVGRNLRRTSPGRALVMLMGAEGAGQFVVGSREWSLAYGRTEVDLTEPGADLDPLQMHEESEQEAEGMQREPTNETYGTYETHGTNGINENK